MTVGSSYQIFKPKFFCYDTYVEDVAMFLDRYFCNLSLQKNLYFSTFSFSLSSNISQYFFNLFSCDSICYI